MRMFMYHCAFLQCASLLFSFKSDAMLNSPRQKEKQEQEQRQQSTDSGWYFWMMSKRKEKNVCTVARVRIHIFSINSQICT